RVGETEVVVGPGVRRGRLDDGQEGAGGRRRLAPREEPRAFVDGRPRPPCPQAAGRGQPEGEPRAGEEGPRAATDPSHDGRAVPTRSPRRRGSRRSGGRGRAVGPSPSAW